MSTNQEPLVRRMPTMKMFNFAKAIANRSYWRCKGKYASEQLKKQGYFDVEFNEALDTGREIIWESPDGKERIRFYATWSKTMEATKMASDGTTTDSEEAQ